MLLIVTGFHLSVVGITGISGDRLMQINQFLKANALAGLGNAYLCLEEHEEAITSYQKSFDFVFYTIGKSRIIADRKPCEKHNLSSAT